MARAPDGGTIRFGIAGWSYPDWEGVVYPPGAGDRLRHVARFVDLLEVNASFYALVSAETARRWLERTADLPHLAFSAKAHRVFTHGPSGGWGAAEVRAVRRFLEPLERAGKLRALLLQFPFGFCDEPAARARLTALAAAFAGLPLVVEVRHGSWRASDALEFLRSLGVSVAGIDLPAHAGDFGDTDTRTGEPGYLRLHGRNAADWFRSDAGRDARYDWLYDDEELDAIAGRVERLAGSYRELIVVANNHYRGKALANIAEIAARVTGEPRPLPDTLVRAYPRLAAVARIVPSGGAATLVPTGDEGAAVAVRGGEGERRGRRRATPEEDAQRELFEA